MNTNNNLRIVYLHLVRAAHWIDRRVSKIMFPRYIVITTIVATFIAGGITQNESEYFLLLYNL